MTRAIGGGLARVTVAAPRRRVDVALPDGVPVAELLPGLLRAAGEELADEGQAHGGWVLRRPDGAPVDPARSLGAAGVLDGEVLHLVPRHQEWPELDYDDVVDAVASGARAVSRSWTAADTRRAGLTGTAVAVLAALALLLTAGPGAGWTTTGLVALGTAVGCVLLAVGLARALGDTAAGALLGVLALPAAALGGLVVTLGDQSLAELQPVHLLTASLVVLVVALAVHLGVGDRTQYSSAGITAGLLGGLGGLLALPAAMDAVDTAAVLLAVVLAATPLVPLLSIRLGGLPVPVLPTTPEELLADETPAPRSRVEARVRRSDELLTGMLGGGAVVAVVCCAVLVASARTSALVLVGLVAGVSLLRTRLFPALRHRLPLAATGALAVALLALAALGLDAADRLVLAVPVLLVLALAALAAGRAWAVRPPSPYLGRVADVLDVVLVLALVPTVCVVAGLYGYVRGLYG
jgi:type VII secretion integral membrane protein EccD